MEEIDNPEMSEYEKFRARNLQRNMEVMKMLGIDTEAFQPATRSPGKEGRSEGDRGQSEDEWEPRKSARTQGETRRSARLRGLTTDGSELVQEIRKASQLKSERQEMLIKRFRDTEQVMETIEVSHCRQKSLFQHTLRRIHTMTHKQLRTRIRVIENARGAVPDLGDRLSLTL
uniref:Uncharacterized protein n=2 Tax=Hanusia phi TaxID=3032 RepID=A0A7S0NAR1_9CRYP|mmetsp:Transcript_5007/g.11836  ORF Transcript_5007/g.11836 Transcript_5007/m.11836 type:complete len:173 (+) Transcript_5007:69-587(+)